MLVAWKRHFFIIKYSLNDYFKLIKKDFLYVVSVKTYLMNLLNYLDIFLNELRKFEIACGNEQLNASTNATENGPIPTINLRMARKQAVAT